MSHRRLTEPEAWREIARRIAEGEWNNRGLCAEISDLCDEGRLSLVIEWDMEDRIKRHLDARKNGWPHNWAYECGTEPEARILAALWLALEAEEEG